MKDLPKRVLGRTGAAVTQLGFGAGERQLSDGADGDGTSERVLKAALDAGINLFDTAPDYGASEERIGRFIGERRDEFFLATKCGCNVSAEGEPLQPGHLWTPARLRANIDQSLRRLRTDRVDLLQMHNPSVRDVQEGGLVQVLEDIRSAGKARFIGVSSTAPALMDFLRMGVFDTFQVPYSMLERTHERMIQEVADAGCGIIIRGGIGLGHRAEADRRDKWERARLLELVPEIDRYELVLRLTLTHPACHTTIVGTTNLGHLRHNIAAAQAGPIPAATYEKVKERMDEVGVRPQ